MSKTFFLKNLKILELFACRRQKKSTQMAQAKETFITCITSN